MYTVLSITIPFFAIIFLGMFFKAKKIFNDEFSKNLTEFALYVTLPPFIFLNIIKSSNNTIFNWDFIIRFEIVTLLILISSFFIYKYFFKKNNKLSSLFALNASYPNYGYMGIPLAILAFGDKSAIPISIILLVDSIVLLSFTSFFSSKLNNKNFIKEFFNTILNMIKNPILASVLFGFIFIIFDLDVYLIIYKFLNLLSLAAPPTALFAICISLFNRVNRQFFKPIIIISSFKLIIHPLLIFLVFYLFPSSVPKIWIKVAILCSCLPVAANVYAMASYYDGFIKETSNSIMITTILSTFTVPIFLFFLL